MLPKIVLAILLLSLVLPARHGQKSVRVRYPWKAFENGDHGRGHSRTLLIPIPAANGPRRAAERKVQQMMGHQRNPMTGEKLSRRKLVSARYQSVFGHSKPIRGSEFVPLNIDLYTGKLATSRRETFNWIPRGNIFLFPRQ